MDTPNKYTKQQIADFRRYESVRVNGSYNMLDPRARETSGLSKERYNFVLNNYVNIHDHIAKEVMDAEKVNKLIKPNCYQVTYEVMEGDNYAGGWCEHYSEVKTLGALHRFERIKKVVPMFKKVWDEPVQGHKIDEAIREYRENLGRKKALDRVKRAEIKLAEAKARLNE